MKMIPSLLRMILALAILFAPELGYGEPRADRVFVNRSVYVGMTYDEASRLLGPPKDSGESLGILTCSWENLIVDFEVGCAGCFAKDIYGRCISWKGKSLVEGCSRAELFDAFASYPIKVQEYSLQQGETILSFTSTDENYPTIVISFNQKGLERIYVGRPLR